MRLVGLRQVWVGCDTQDVPVGMVIASSRDGAAYVEELDVLPAHGRRGLGTLFFPWAQCWQPACAAASGTFSAKRPSGDALRRRGASDGDMNAEQPTPGMTVHCQEIVELVTDYLEGTLDPDMTAEVEAHLQLCDGCDTYVKQIRATVHALGKVPVESLSPDPPMGGLFDGGVSVP